MNNPSKKIITALVVAGLVLGTAIQMYAQNIPIPSINLGIGQSTGPKDVAVTLQTLALITVLTLAPAIIMMCTSFIRISVVFMFITRALSTQNIPPQQIVMGLAIFLTFFVMAPTLKEMNDNALKPYFAKQISVTEMYDRGIKPVRKFMFKQTRPRDIALFVHLAKTPRPHNQDEVPTYVLIPSFMISELKTAFEIGILIFIPFIVIDLIVASILMSMGMIMLPPVMISLPLKLIIFVLADGWHLITLQLVRSFH
jgi:flagellar biosynthesis protein FliP